MESKLGQPGQWVGFLVYFFFFLWWEVFLPLPEQSHLLLFAFVLELLSGLTKFLRVGRRCCLSVVMFLPRFSLLLFCPGLREDAFSSCGSVSCDLSPLFPEFSGVVTPRVVFPFSRPSLCPASDSFLLVPHLKIVLECRAYSPRAC